MTTAHQAVLLDGEANHQMLCIHPFRYAMHRVPYDTIWIGSAILRQSIGLLVPCGAHPASPAVGRH